MSHDSGMDRPSSQPSSEPATDKVYKGEVETNTSLTAGYFLTFQPR
jgi:hypothetical protein